MNTTTIPPDIAAAARRAAAFFRERPEAWTTGTGAETAHGCEVGWSSGLAVRWCAAGRMSRELGRTFNASDEIDSRLVQINDNVGREAAIAELERIGGKP